MTQQPQPLQWKDRDGNVWSTALDLPATVRLKNAGYDIKDHERLADTLGDPYSAVDFIVEAARPQWEAKQLTEADFLDRMTDQPNQLEIVLAATVAGLVDFFRRFRDELRAVVVEKAMQAAELGQRRMLAKIMSPTVDRALKAELERRESLVDAELQKLISGATSGS